ncbi:hypothetical protein BBJ28_00001264 [Nothophytophthora sp. Chile5]|nr:hypothetical protein BBJ28_00001264 [Nothophytophthora sp. Chile5]
MSRSPTSRPVLSPRAPAFDSESIVLSPLVQLMPTGYRNIQPFQKGKGWHTNGRTPRRRVDLTQATSDGDETSQDGVGSSSEKDRRGVVFPLLTNHELGRPGTHGPDASSVEAARTDGCVQPDDREEQDEAAIGPFPRAPMTPTAPGAPRRPSWTDSRRYSDPSGSIRSRLATGNSGNDGDSSRPTSPATVGLDDENVKAQDEEKEMSASPGPDPILMQQLWQEYAARSHAANHVVDAQAYHRRMHHRYGEQRALKERVAQLEQALAAVQFERDEAQGQAEAAAKRLALDLSTAETAGATPAYSASAFQSVVRNSKTELTNAEERSYRERSFALERALVQTKTSLATLQVQLQEQTEQAAERTRVLEAQLELERQSSLELARQLREASAGFTQVSAALVETRLALEREQQSAREVAEQIRVQNAKVLADTRRAQLETRVKMSVRSLGREALRHKTEALMVRALLAEQNLQAAQLETERMRQERDAARSQREQGLSGHALQGQTLDVADGVPSILKRGTTLSNSSRLIAGHLLMLQVLYEENQDSEDPDDGFSVHFVAYEPRSAQGDVLTFRLRDVQRLVPNHESSLTPQSQHRHEQLQELVELLVKHVHAGYRDGRLVLTEASGSEAITRLLQEQLEAQQEQHRIQQVTVYRGTRYLDVLGAAGREDVVLADLSVTEAFTPATSQIWWLEVRVVALIGKGEAESLVAKVDPDQLLTLCPPFASYRPSESFDSGKGDEAELFAVHEALLDPLFSHLRVICYASGVFKLEVNGLEAESRPSSGSSTSSYNQRRRTTEPQHGNEEVEETQTEVAPRQKTREVSTLTHRCVVKVDDVFYCVRLRELWDGELLLDITMDDPETQRRFHCVLNEPQLAKLAARLVQNGALDEGEEEGKGDTREGREAAALQVKYGIASVLHRPLCNLVKSHLQPVLPHPNDSRGNRHARGEEDGEITLGALLEDEENRNTPQQSFETRVLTLDPPMRASLGRGYHQELQLVVGSADLLADEQAVRNVLQQLLAVGNGEDKAQIAVDVRRQRLGTRFLDSSAFALVRAISARLPSSGDAMVVAVSPLSSEAQAKLVLVLGIPRDDDEPLRRAFEALGLEAIDDVRARSSVEDGSSNLPAGGETRSSG